MYKPVPFLFSLKFYVLSSFMVLTIASALSTSSVFISSPFTSFAQSHFILTVLFPFYGSTTFWTGIIEICLSFSVMVEFLSNMEKKYSTTYMLINIYVQAFIHNALFLISCYVLVNSFGEKAFAQFFTIDQNNLNFFNAMLSMRNYGWFPITIIYLWKDVTEDPEGQTKFCFMNVKKKYIPLILAAVIVLCSGRLISISIATAIGIYQSVSKYGYKLPLSVYTFTEQNLFNFLRKRLDFISIDDIFLPELKSQCSDNSSDHRIIGEQNYFSSKVYQDHDLQQILRQRNEDQVRDEE